VGHEHPLVNGLPSHLYWALVPQSLGYLREHLARVPYDPLVSDLLPLPFAVQQRQKPSAKQRNLSVPQSYRHHLPLPVREQLLLMAVRLEQQLESHYKTVPSSHAYLPQYLLAAAHDPDELPIPVGKHCEDVFLCADL